ncbi:MAG: hypothetical protein Ct9H300mP7_3600 [Verrucomicrobiota bacterium]|nr:MAG: hypothetical protein Ct9H300mP7_3600 [Verrucomicrobiota bacterium]
MVRQRLGPWGRVTGLHEAIGYISNWAGSGFLTGPNSAVTVEPSGATSARYSPALAMLKFVCSSEPAMLRFFPDAKISRNPRGKLNGRELPLCHGIFLVSKKITF